MGSVWGVSQPLAVTTNSTITAISETLQSHTHTHTHAKIFLTLHFRKTMLAEMEDVSSHWSDGFQKEWLEWTEKTH